MTPSHATPAHAAKPSAIPPRPVNGRLQGRGSNDLVSENLKQAAEKTKNAFNRNGSVPR